ncbi:MAG TPA: hypothetical protein H9858_06165 [Candidatus Blautia stercoravium]|nr:hypothetical protein [Candidatus Blautia stercoravium]
MRKQIKLNSDWLFSKEDQLDFCKNQISADSAEKVEIPHTWNQFDGQDGGNDYYRAGCWYQKYLNLPQISETEELYLEFGAINSVADVYLGGKHLGTHSGGYSAFRFDITRFAGQKRILLAVRADNSDNPNVYPRTADYTFFGGIYRDVTLWTVPKTHFAMNHFASSGIYIDTQLEKKDAIITIRSEVEHAVPNMQVRYEILHTDGSSAAQLTTPWSDATSALVLEHPHLWNGRPDPYLYTLRSTLLDKQGGILDQLDISFGIRSFEVSLENGFFLNGVSYPLHGVSRHQDRKDKGWAIGNAEHEEDMEFIREIGATSIRLAHYQHAPYFYDLCDKNGMVVWAEIPFISQMSKTPAANENLISQMKELILQNYNHPSICFWGLQNETTIQNPVDNGEDHELTAMVQQLHKLCKELNPARLTTQACLGNVSGDNSLVSISDLVSYNHYYGWYIGEAEQLGDWFDEFHAKYPQTIVGLSEYGGDGSIRYHSDKPRVNDYTEEYQALLHEKQAAILEARPFVWSYYIWNMFDFGSDRRDEGGAPGINQKGLITYDRKHRKDTFYLYKAYWSDEPFVHICGNTYVNRTTVEREIKIYSNQQKVTLYINNTKIGTIKGEKIFRFQVCLAPGKNVVMATAEGISGNAEETLVLNGVEKSDKSYKMTELEGKAGIVNWFENADDFHFVYGSYSVNDRVADILENEDGRTILEKYFSPIIKMEILEMYKNFKLAKLISKIRKVFSSEMAAKLNDELSKIPKPETDAE